MSDIYSTEKILQYLDGEMGGEELEAFRQRLASDPVLQAEVSELRSAVQAVKLGGAEARVRNIHHEMMGELKGANKGKVVGFGSWMARMAVAATVVALLAAAWFYMQSSAGSIAGEHYIAYVVDVNRGMHNTSVIEEAYNSRNYNEVVTIAAEGGISGGDSLVTAISYYELHDYKKALELLMPLQGNSRYGEDADYYIGFCYLMIGERAKAIETFSRIQKDEGHVYHGVVTSAMMRKLRFRSN